MSRYKSAKRWPLGPIRAVSSRILIPCYAIEGRYWTAIVPAGKPLRLLLVAPDRKYAWADGFSSIKGAWCCVTHQAPWVVAGWLPADGSLPLGDTEEVDPNVARLNFLTSPVAHFAELNEPMQEHSAYDYSKDWGRVDGALDA